MTTTPTTAAEAPTAALGSAEPAAASAPEPRVGRGLALAVAAFVLVVGAAGYAVNGNHSAWSIGPGEGVAVADSPAEQQAQVEAMVKQLEERLKAQPEDAEGWRLLSRSYLVMGRTAEAVTAQQRVVRLQPQSAQALADLADAMGMAAGRNLQGEPEKLILQAVKLDPSNLKALALAGTVSFNRDEFKAAVAYWERVVQLAPPDSGWGEQLREAIGEARQRGGLAPVASAASAASKPTATAQATGTAAAGAEAIRGRLSLAPAARAQVQPQDTLFVFVRPAEGSRMPLAIVKKTVADLPLDFSLGDAQAMNPAAKLSALPAGTRLVVGARISKSGNAMPQPGDLEVFSSPVTAGASGLSLELAAPR